MYEITLENFRCFRNRQTARLAPLTLLVGENSTGKTSFLAIIRALVDVALGFRNPDFKEEPYDLGSFDEITHRRGASGGRAKTFEAGFRVIGPKGQTVDGMTRHFSVTFGKRGTAPVPVRRCFSMGSTWADECFETGQPYILRIGTYRGSWEKKVPTDAAAGFDLDDDLLAPLIHTLRSSFSKDEQKQDRKFIPMSGSPAFNSEDEKLIYGLLVNEFWSLAPLLFASAPVRTKPRRTYDPSRLTSDPEGNYVPMLLANTYFQERDKWRELKQRLEDFGKAAGLFDEISIRPLGKRDSEPFQLQVRRFGARLKGPQRNLIDVGYGVSQVLPVITELLRPDAPFLFLLQQPEIHLHPSAQAALGSLFCHVAGSERLLVVETHSDHLIDRVRMDVRDKTTTLRPEDVSILYFERGDLDVRIHSLRIDEEGNILGAPDGYRQFFMEETNRSIGL